MQDLQHILLFFTYTYQILRAMIVARGDDMKYPNGLLLPHALLGKCRAAFCLVDTDENGNKRLFFDNSGGSLRLKRCVEAKAALEQFPDCPERIHKR